MKGLIIDEPWVTLIASGQKTWEMRSRNTHVRGRIGLIRKGSKTVIGVADLVDSLPKLSTLELRSSFAKHQVPEDEIDEDFKWDTAWVLHGAQSLRKPVPYSHPGGAVIWVNLDPEAVAAIQQQIVER